MGLRGGTVEGEGGRGRGGVGTGVEWVEVQRKVRACRHVRDRFPTPQGSLGVVETIPLGLPRSPIQVHVT